MLEVISIGKKERIDGASVVRPTISGPQNGAVTARAPQGHCMVARPRRVIQSASDNKKSILQS
jgi:hypothetical protein